MCIESVRNHVFFPVVYNSVNNIFKLFQKRFLSLHIKNGTKVRVKEWEFFNCMYYPRLNWKWSFEVSIKKEMKRSYAILFWHRSIFIVNCIVMTFYFQHFHLQNAKQQLQDKWQHGASWTFPPRNIVKIFLFIGNGFRIISNLNWYEWGLWKNETVSDRD